MNTYEIRYGRNTETVLADARGIRTGRIPPAVMKYATNKLNYANRYGDILYPYVEISLVELPNVSIGTAGERTVLEIISHAEVVRDNGAELG